MKIISRKNESIFALLTDICQRTNNQTALAQGKLQNDFGNVLYLTNNRARATQLNQQLVAELCSSALNQGHNTVIPPTVVPYTAGFTYLAALAKFGYIDTLHVCKYTDAWFELFVCRLAKEVIPDGFFISSAETNQRAHLSKDFGVFIRDLVLNLKEENLTAFSENQPDEVSKLFIKSYQAYQSQMAQFADKENQFLHPLDAYHYLYTHGVPSAHPFALKKVVVVENFEMLEPMFQAILKQIECPVFCIENSPIVDFAAYQNKTFLYDFMTPLDEAEFIGWKVKSLLQEGVKPFQIGVACANEQSREILELVFKRMHIAGSMRMKMNESPYYKLVKTVFSLIYREKKPIYLQDIFFSKKSKFNLKSAKDFYNFRQAFIGKGLQTTEDPCAALKDTISEFIQRTDLEDAQTAPLLNDFLDLIQHPCKITEIANQVINAKMDIKLVNEIMIALYELDENLSVSDLHYAEEVQKMFGVLDTRELNVPREPSWLESAAPKEEEESDPLYHIDIIKPEAVNTMRSEHLFLCGFNAGSDKEQMLSYPYPLARGLQLKTMPEKRRETAEHIVYALNHAQHNYVSYAYLNMNGKEEGPSTFIKYLKTHLNPKYQPIFAQNGMLLKAEDVVTLQDNQIPEPSWSLTLQGHWKDKQGFLLPPCTLNDLLQTVLSRQEDGFYSIPAKLFTHFILCPRMFVYELLAKYGRFDREDDTRTKNLAKGTFYHKLFELGARKAGFLSPQAAEIQKALEEGLIETLEQPKISIHTFTPLSKDEFVTYIREQVLGPFSKLESSRRYVPNKKITTEQDYQLPINKTVFKLSCVVDRIDETAEQTVLWDYKTGKENYTLEFFQPRGGKLKGNENVLQLALYMYIYAHHYPDKQHITAGNIYLNGMDNKGTHEYSEQEKKLEDLLDKVFCSFENMLATPIYKIPFHLTHQESATTDLKELCDASTCISYCNFKEVCDIVGEKK